MSLKSSRPSIVPLFIPAGAAIANANGLVTVADSTTGISQTFKKSDIVRVEAAENATAGVAHVVPQTLSGAVANGDNNTLSILGWDNGRNGFQPITVNVKQPTTGATLSLTQLAAAFALAINLKNIGITASSSGAVLTLTANTPGPRFTTSFASTGATVSTIGSVTAGVYPVGQVAYLQEVIPHHAALITVECARTKVLMDYDDRDGGRNKVEYHLYWGDTTTGASPTDGVAFAAAVTASSNPNQVIQNA